MAKAIPDLTGRRFGRLIVIGPGTPWKPMYRYWLCRCDCGKEKNVLPNNLTKGTVQSCGCLVRDLHKTMEYRRKLYKAGTAFRRVIRQYKHDAKRRNLSWELTDDQAHSLMTSPCHYTGRSPSKQMIADSGEIFLYNGIDRLINSEGYVWENCVPCCHEINMMKHVIPYDLFISLCKEVANPKVEEPVCQ